MFDSCGCPVLHKQWRSVAAPGELDFGSFLEPQVVTIELPPAAKTPHTVFRWWQPQQGENRPTTQSLIGHKQDLNVFLCLR